MALTRSEQMARIKGSNTKPELLLRSELWKHGLRYRLDAKVPVGRPDLVFPRQRIAIFIDGCFWHGCPIHYVRPRSRHDFWARKLGANVERDRRHTLTLESQGWVVLRFWEHEVTDALEMAVERIAAAVQTRPRCTEPQWRVTRVDSIDPSRDWERRYLVDLRNACLARTVDGPRMGRSGAPIRRRPSSPPSATNPPNDID